MKITHYLTPQRARLLTKLLGLVGLGLAIAGLTARFILGRWDTWSGVLTILGLGAIGFWLLFQGTRTSPAQLWGRRSTQAGVNITATTLAVLVILGLINFIGVRHTIRYDLSEKQLFTLAAQTQSLIKNLKEPVKVWIFMDQPDAQLRELLENYRRLKGDRFSFEFVDPNRRISVAREFGVSAVGDVYLERGERRQFVQNVNPELRQTLTEGKLTASLEQLLNDRQDRVYFLQGHGEPSLERLSQMTQALTGKNIASDGLVLAQELSRGTSPEQAIPADASAVVVAGPQRPLLPQEVQALQAYLKRDGSVFLMVRPNLSQLNAPTGLEPLLQSWGVKLDNRIVLNANQDVVGVDAQGQAVGLNPTDSLVTDYGDHPITKDFQGGISLFPQSRPILVGSADGVLPTVLLRTGDRSWAESELKDPIQFDPGKDLEGPIDLAVALEKVAQKPTSKTPKGEDQKKSEKKSEKKSDAQPSSENAPEDNKPGARMVVMGSADYFTNGLFSQQLNGDVFLNAISWLTKRDDQPLSVRPKDPTNRRITLKPEQMNVIALLSTIVLPLIGLVTSVGLWWQRR